MKRDKRDKAEPCPAWHVLAQDAARYRWLRASSLARVELFAWGNFTRMRGAVLDREIDTMMAQAAALRPPHAS